MVMESLLATYPLIRSARAAVRPPGVAESCGSSVGGRALASIAASLSSCSPLFRIGKGEPSGHRFACELQQPKDCAAEDDFTTSCGRPPSREAGAASVCGP